MVRRRENLPVLGQQGDHLAALGSFQSAVVSVSACVESLSRNDKFHFPALAAPHGVATPRSPPRGLRALGQLPHQRFNSSYKNNLQPGTSRRRRKLGPHQCSPNRYFTASQPSSWRAVRAGHAVSSLDGRHKQLISLLRNEPRLKKTQRYYSGKGLVLTKGKNCWEDKWECLCEVERALS